VFAKGASGVVSTNALELGIDIGSLDAVGDGGYPERLPAPGTCRTRGAPPGSSCAVMVASSSPLDQFIVHIGLLLDVRRNTPTFSLTISKFW